MTRTRYLAAGLLTVATIMAAVTYVDRDGPADPRAAGRLPAVADGAGPGSSAAALEQAPGRPQLAELDRLIGSFDEQTAGSPSAAGFTFLGQLELQRARLTGDVGSFARAERALEDAVDLAPEDPEPSALLAGVRFTTHDFTGALALASDIYARDRDLGALAVKGDAELELGRYDLAAEDYAALADAQPDASSTLVRRSRLAFLLGDAAEATRLAAAAERAAASEGAFGAARSWYAAYRGKLALDGGRYGEAVRHYRRAVAEAPDYHVAIAGLAAARAARGDVGAAIALYERAVALVPEPATLGALGDLYAVSGDERAAADRFATVDAIATLQAVHRRLYDRQLASFHADHEGDLEGALAAARESLEVRRDIYGYDLLGWISFRLGAYDDARAASDRAIAMGTPDAKLWFHAGMISAALGDTDRARSELSRALELHPMFDPLLAPEAAKTLDRLGGPV
jgi:tetratricopeptide (TPR) repeat protein